MASNPALRAYVRTHVENRPGVYSMYGPGNELLYVGKSIRVRTRLLSYFRAPRGNKAWELIRESTRIEWEYIPNEFAALIREMKLIQRHRPRFNVQHKRKRIYAFIKVTRERAPRILPVTRVVEDGATYYGPFPRVGALARAVREVSHELGLRDCASSTPIFFDDQFEFFESGRPPRCLRADLRTCLAPCCGRISADRYLEAVETAKRFLEGRAQGPLRDLEANMKAAAIRHDYEYAGVLRDRLERMRRFREELVGFRGRVEDLSFVYRVPGFRGDDRLYLVHRGRIHVDLPYPKDAKSRARATRAVEEVFGGRAPRAAGMAPEEASEILLVARWFRLNPKERKRALKPERWLEERGVHTADLLPGGGGPPRARPRRASKARRSRGPAPRSPSEGPDALPL